MAITFSGLASGLDSASLIDKLVAVERQRATAINTKVNQLNRQGTILDDLAARLGKLGDGARALDSSAELRAVTTSRSDADHASIAASAEASDASHTLRVASTARGQVVTSRTFASDAAGVLGAGSVQIAGASGDPVTVSWTAADSLSAIARRINDAGGAATASVLHDGSTYRLIATARATGTAAAPVFTDGGDGLGWSQAGNVTLSARDAVFTFDGVTLTRGTNVVADALPGVTLTLTAAHTSGQPDTLLTVAADRDAIRAKVQTLVDTWNGIDQALDVQLGYNGTTKGGDTLFGDSTLRQLQGALGRLATDSHGDKSLAALGVKIDTGGRLSLDAAKFDAALTSDPAAVEALFVSGGLAGKLDSLVTTYTRAGDGFLTAKGASLDRRVAGYQRDIERIETAATSLGERLTRQFTALEKAISEMKTQSSQLASILGT